MKIELQNPIALVSLNFLGFGFDVAFAHVDGEKVFTLVVNFAFGSWSKTWVR